MNKYFPPEVMASVDRVFQHGAEKHTHFGWVALDPRGPKGIDHQIAKALGHIAKWEYEGFDRESLENHLSHAITRLVIALDMIHHNSKVREDGPERDKGAGEAVSQTSTVSDYIQKEVAAWKKATGRD